MSLNGSPKWMYNAGADFYPYLINQSLRLNSADSSYLSRTPSSSGNRRTFTFSCWMKRGTVNETAERALLSAGSNNSNHTNFGLGTNTDTLQFQHRPGDASGGHLFYRSTTKYSDPSAWYHIVLAIDTTQASASNRIKVYVNGTQDTTFVLQSGKDEIQQNEEFDINEANHLQAVGARKITNIDSYWDGYLAEVHLIDGTSYGPETFGETKENIWIPKEYTGSYGTNGFYLKFVAGAEGTDSSGNGNNFTHTPGNTSRNRPVQDSPTNNFCLIPTNNNPSLLVKEHQGMRLNTSRTGYWDGAYGNFAVKSGKWYYEVQMNETAGDNFRTVPGWQNAPEERSKVYNRLGTSGDPFGTSSSDDLGNSGHYAFPPWNATFFGNGGYTGTKSAASKGDVLNVAVDFDNNKIYFGLNGTYLANDGGTDGDPANGTNESLSGLLNNGKFYSPSVCLRNDSSAGSNTVRFNFGHDRSFGANLSLGTAYADENGFGEFRYSVPSGFLALCSQNLPDPAVDPNGGANPTDFFNTVLYTGNGSDGRSVTGVGFDPDFVWLKSRNLSTSHLLTDRVRGAPATLFSEDDYAESNSNGGGFINSFVSDGFTVTSGGSGDDAVNDSGDTYVAWNWLAGGSAVTNNDGSVTSSVSANTKAGFSIVTHDNGSGTRTVGHGLGVVPELIIEKKRDATGDWLTQFTAFDGTNDYMRLNTTVAKADGVTAVPTTTVYSPNVGGGADCLAYCFHSVDGYSKIGIYEGNANADGPVINCGFRPAFILFKNIEFAELWVIFDNKRDVGNLVDRPLYPNLVNTESVTSTRSVDFLSTGFKIRGTDTSVNRTGNAHLYLALADQPFKYANGK